MELKGLAAATANHLGFLDIYALLRRKITKSQVAILIYHRVSPQKDRWSSVPLSPESFERAMAYFSRNCMVFPLEKLAQDLKRGTNLPPRVVAITFDDGYKDNYIYAYPILKKYRIPATIFLTTGHIGRGNLFWWDKVSYVIHHMAANQLSLDGLGSYSIQSDLAKDHVSSLIVERLKNLTEQEKNILIKRLIEFSEVDIPAVLGKALILSWDEIREMSNDGIVFGAHSVNHPILTNLPREEAKWEIIQSKKDIEEKVDREVVSFSYPNGNFDLELVRFIEESGFTCAVSVLPGRLIGFEDDIYTLGRMAMSEDFNKFKVVFSGL